MIVIPAASTPLPTASTTSTKFMPKRSVENGRTQTLAASYTVRGACDDGDFLKSERWLSGCRHTGSSDKVGFVGHARSVATSHPDEDAFVHPVEAWRGSLDVG
jgi:hypothetical protein